MLFRTPVRVGRTETCITFNINIIIQVASNWDIPDDVCIINLWLLSLAKFISLLLKSLRHCCYNTACPLGNTDCHVYISYDQKNYKPACSMMVSARGLIEKMDYRANVLHNYHEKSELACHATPGVERMRNDTA